MFRFPKNSIESLPITDSALSRFTRDCSLPAFIHGNVFPSTKRVRSQARTPRCLLQPAPILRPHLAFRLLADAASAGKAVAADVAATASNAAADAASSAASNASNAAAGVSALDKFQSILAVVDLLLLIGVTIAVAIVSYQNSIIDRNDKRSREIIKARVDQFGGEENVNPEDMIFSTDPSTKGGRVPWPGGRAPTAAEVFDLKTDIRPFLTAPKGTKTTATPTSASATTSGDNRATRRKASILERREKKQKEKRAKDRKGGTDSKN